jgi:hypothetical protein
LVSGTATKLALLQLRSIDFERSALRFGLIV